MSNREHIQDEALELYALGGLTEEEAAALGSHLASCGECAMKLAQSRGTAALLSFAAKQEQPAGTIKSELMARIRANREREEHYAWPLPANHREDKKPKAVAKSAVANAGGWWKWAMVPAAVALALVSLGLSWQNRKVSLALEKQRQATQTLLHDREETEKLVGILAAADTVTIALAPTGETVGSGVVKYNRRMGMVAYSAQLPEAPAAKSYQMWLVQTNGAPINAGVMEKGSHSIGAMWLAQFPANTEAKAFVVTAEPAGGAPQPTGPRVLVGAT